MPVIPSDTSDFPSAAQQSSNKDTSASSQGKEPKKATAMDHISKGPQVPENMPPKASREETEARMKELNQK